MSWWLVLNQTLFISNSGNVTAVRSNNPIFEGFLQISHGYLSDEFSFCQPMKCTRRLKFSGRSKTEYSWHGICMSYKLVCVLRGQGTRPRKTQKKDKTVFSKDRIFCNITIYLWFQYVEYLFQEVPGSSETWIQRAPETLAPGLAGSLVCHSRYCDIHIQLKGHVYRSNSFVGSKRIVETKQCRGMASHFMRNTVADNGSALTEARPLRTV